MAAAAKPCKGKASTIHQTTNRRQKQRTAATLANYPVRGHHDLAMPWRPRENPGAGPTPAQAPDAIGALPTMARTQAARARPQRRSRSALPTTLTLLRAIAAPATIGLSSPKAASGMPTTL